MTLFLQREATYDLEDATYWYQNQLPGLGIEFVEEILATLDLIEENPLASPVVYQQLRRSVVHRFPYCIFYIASDERIDVIAVMHASRDPNQWQSRL